MQERGGSHDFIWKYLSGNGMYKDMRFMLFILNYLWEVIVNVIYIYCSYHLTPFD